VELLLLIVVFSGSLVTLLSASSHTARQQSDARSRVDVALALQDAGEALMEYRRHKGYGFLPPETPWVACNAYAAANGEVPLSNLVVPVGASCRLRVTAHSDAGCAGFSGGCTLVEVELLPASGPPGLGGSQLVFAQWNPAP